MDVSWNFCLDEPQKTTNTFDWTTVPQVRTCQLPTCGQQQLLDHNANVTLPTEALPVNVELMNILTTRVLRWGRFSMHPART